MERTFEERVQRGKELNSHLYWVTHIDIKCAPGAGGGYTVRLFDRDGYLLGTIERTEIRSISTAAYSRIGRITPVNLQWNDGTDWVKKEKSFEDIIGELGKKTSKPKE